MVLRFHGWDEILVDGVLHIEAGSDLLVGKRVDWSS
jgi:hypothetical protein